MTAMTFTGVVIGPAGRSTLDDWATSRPPMSVSIFRAARHARVRLEVAIFPSKLRQ
jgi:hypothetical protein